MQPVEDWMYKEDRTQGRRFLHKPDPFLPLTEERLHSYYSNLLPGGEEFTNFY